MLPKDASEENTKTKMVRDMGLWTGVSIIIGNVIGGGIFISPVAVFQHVGSPAAALMVWAICGMLCLTGAFCYAELGLTIPTSGGDYIYGNFWLKIVIITGKCVKFL
jgi:amino acid transporter